MSILLLRRAASFRRRKLNAPPAGSRIQQQQLIAWKQRERKPPPVSNDSSESETDREEILTSNGSMENGAHHEEVPAPFSPPVSNDRTNNSQRNVVVNQKTNLDRFLESITPMIRARLLPKTTITVPGGRTFEIEHPPYFLLKDLWDLFEEWSAMAVGVPMVLNGTDSQPHSVTQYYVPYLSTIRLYTHPKRPAIIRTPVDDSTNYGGNLAIRWPHRHNETADENITRLNRLTLANRPFRGWSSNETAETKPLGHLAFEHCEMDEPPDRGPLFGRIQVLANDHPALMEYKSCDLSPSSCVSVYWFPIYKIPDTLNLPKVETCFLTFHSLSTQSPGASENGPPFRGFNIEEFHRAKMPSKLPLHISGLGFNKFTASHWINTEVIESPKVNSLLREAENCCRRLRVYHPDYVNCSAVPDVYEQEHEHEHAI